MFSPESYLNKDYFFYMCRHCCEASPGDTHFPLATRSSLVATCHSSSINPTPNANWPDLTSLNAPKGGTRPLPILAPFEY